jgi:hypothetical protein
MTLEGHAEVLKLARLLGTEPARLDYLEALSPADVRELRERAAVALHDNDRRFARVALASRIPPAPMTAWIAQHLFGALLCARIAGLLDPRRAIDLAKRMSPGYLADMAMQLDPRRVHEIIFGLPPALIGEVAAELTAREEYIAMGRFVGHMTDDALLEAFAVIDDASLLRISYFVEEKDQLDHVVGLLETDRIQGAIRAATPADLWPQALDLLTRISPEQAGELADLAAAEDDAVLGGMVHTAQRDRLWDVVLPVTETMSDEGLQRLAGLPAMHAPQVLAAIADAAVASGRLPDLMPLMECMPPAAQQLVRERIGADVAEG